MTWLKSEKEIINDILEAYDYGDIDDKIVIEQLAWDMYRAKRNMNDPELKLHNLQDGLERLDLSLKNQKDGYIHACGDKVCLMEDGYEDEHCVIWAPTITQLIAKIIGEE